jgi:hypothetical protein
MSVSYDEPIMRASMQSCGIPDYMHDGLVLWVLHGIPTGSFLWAVLENDLSTACACADETNQHRLFNYVKWLHNHAPIGSWGSPRVVQQWYESRREKEDAVG